MIKVFLREKKLKHGKNGLYLDFYPPIVDRDSQKQTRREHLRLYVYEKPKTELEREHNKETRMLGENIKSQRQLELQAGSYGFVATRSRKGDFLEYFRKIADSKRQGSKSNYDHWLSVLKYVKKFTNDVCKFGDIDEKFCKDFKEFLLKQDRISQNSASGYFDKFKVAVRQGGDKSDKKGDQELTSDCYFSFLVSTSHQKMIYRKPIVFAWQQQDEQQ